MNDDAIAEELGYASRATVYAIVHKGLAPHESGETVNLRELAAVRLDLLQQAPWSRATAGTWLPSLKPDGFARYQTSRSGRHWLRPTNNGL